MTLYSIIKIIEESRLIDETYILERITEDGNLDCEPTEAEYDGLLAFTVREILDVVEQRNLHEDVRKNDIKAIKNVLMDIGEFTSRSIRAVDWISDNSEEQSTRERLQSQKAGRSEHLRRIAARHRLHKNARK